MIWPITGASGLSIANQLSQNRVNNLQVETAGFLSIYLSKR